MSRDKYYSQNYIKENKISFTRYFEKAVSVEILILWRKFCQVLSYFIFNSEMYFQFSNKNILIVPIIIDTSNSKHLPSHLNIVQPGDKLVVETIATHSEATVVWQDGAIEPGIPSRELFPILHVRKQTWSCICGEQNRQYV